MVQFEVWRKDELVSLLFVGSLVFEEFEGSQSEDVGHLHWAGSDEGSRLALRL